MRSERQALADIAKLREQRDRGKGSPWFAKQVDIVLADVQPEPALPHLTGTYTCTCEIGHDHPSPIGLGNEGLSLRPAPVGGTMDRDALTRLLFDGRAPNDAFALRDAVLALVRPVDGVVLTPEEAHAVAIVLK